MENNQNNNSIQPQTPAGNNSQKIQPEKGFNISPVRTYAEEVKMAMQKDNVSTIKIAMAEAKKKQEEAKVEEETDPRSKKNITIVLVSLGLLVFGGLGFLGAWYYSNVQKATVATTKPMHRSSILPYDEESVVKLDKGERDEVLSALSNSYSQKYEDDTRLVYLPVLEGTGTSSSLITTERFFSLLGTRAPDILVRNINSQYMFGVDLGSGKKNPQPFILFYSNSFDSVYSGMLTWEPSMADDIGDIFFTKNDLLVKSPVSTSTATSTIQNASSSPVVAQTYILADSLSFKDEVISNRDIRTLRTKEGKLLLYYTFVNDKLLLIAKDFGTIEEITKRLATRQFTQ